MEMERKDRYEECQDLSTVKHRVVNLCICLTSKPLFPGFSVNPS